jgi:phospholipid/cholesterol/gamma-HCH transport system permease protein
MTPVLTVITDLLGALGGAFIAFTSLGITPEKYMENIVEYVGITSFLSGIIKSVFFGIIIAVVSCYQGFNTEGGAEGVGKATIAAVVISSMIILVSDYFLTYLLTFAGL